jgi:hypothetical protein
MRFTYVRADKVVGIDGKFINIDNSNFNQEIDAIQWYDTWGEIEYVNRQERNNERFEDVSFIKDLVFAWNDANSQ